jgi:SAM-dependent methyltransferase
MASNELVTDTMASVWKRLQRLGLPTADTKSGAKSAKELQAEGRHNSVIAACDAINRVIKLAILSLLAGEKQSMIEVDQPFPFTRAASDDYSSIVRLWTGDLQRQITTLPPRSCPACGSDNHFHIFDSYDGYPYSMCRECASWFVPYTVADVLIDDFFHRFPEAEKIAARMMSNREAGTREADRSRFAEYFDKAAVALAQMSEPIRYLDIGCGVGHSLDLAQERGMIVAGLEVNQVALEIARAQGRNVFHPNDFHGHQTFNFISMFETLEHITNPDEIIATSAARLNEMGLIIITIPNRACWEISIMKQRSFHVFGGFEGVGHINLFDARSLGRLLRRHGLELIYVDGQFSSNIIEIFDYFLGPDRTGADAVGEGRISIRVPKPIFEILNSIGPAISQLDRLTDRSPILIAFACHERNARSYASVVKAFEEQRRGEVLSSIA